MVHFEDKGMFPKVHWRILEDSGRFLARIPRGLVLNSQSIVTILLTGVAGLHAIVIVIISWLYDCPMCHNMIQKNARM